jgi:G6PDH family F420-dependent oxidoreductase
VKVASTTADAISKVEQARLWDLPPERVPVGIGVSGQSSCHLAGAKADIMVAVEPKSELVEMFEAEGGTGQPKVGQIALAYDTDREAAVRRAHEQFRWFGLGWQVSADLPNPEGFDAATQFISPDQVGDALGCGPEVDEHVEKIKPFIDAGFDEARWCRSAPGTRTRSSTGRRRSCCRRCARYRTVGAARQGTPGPHPAAGCGTVRE